MNKNLHPQSKMSLNELKKTSAEINYLLKGILFMLVIGVALPISLKIFGVIGQ